MTDYGAIGTAAALIYIAFVQAKNERSRKKTAKTVDEIHTLTNGAMTAQKKLLAEVTAAKAFITKDTKDLQAAADASKDYISSVQVQSNLSDIETKKPNV